MNYIRNIGNGLTISGKDIAHFEELISSNIFNVYFFPLVKSKLDDAARKLQSSPDDSNHLISLIFEVESYQELQFLQIQASLDKIDRGLNSKIADFENLIPDAYLLILFDRLVASVTENNLWGVIAAMADLFTISAHDSYETNQKNSISSNSQKAGSASNEENKALKAEFLIWYRSNKSKYSTKAAAARDGTKIVPINVRVVERWIREYEKLISEIGEEEYWDE
jgi:hypothetical protein